MLQHHSSAVHKRYKSANKHKCNYITIFIFMSLDARLYYDYVYVEMPL